MRFFIHIVILLLCFRGNLVAQPQEYLFSFLGVKDGLQEENIIAVQQDTKGYIWIATHNTVQRYDGKRFINFYHKDNDPRSIPAGGILGMQIDKKDRLWILTGTTTSALGYLDVNNFTYNPVAIRFPPGDYNKARSAIHLDKDDNLLLIFIGFSYVTFNENSKEAAQKYNPFQLPEGWGPLYLWQDDSRNYWMGAQKGLLKYSASKKTMSYRGHNMENDPIIKKFENATNIVYAYVDKTNRFWITGWPQNKRFIKCYSPATGETTEWQHAIGRSLQGKYYELYGITEMNDGSLWMAGHNLFAKLNKTTNIVEPVHNDALGEYTIRYDIIHQLYEDREKNIWISTNKGLYRFNPPAQLFKAVKNRLPGHDSAYTADVTGMLQTPDGEILVSTWGNGIFSYDKDFNPVRSKYVSRIYPPGENMVWCMTRRKNGDIWRGCQDGYLFIYEASTGKTTRLRPPVFENSTILQVEEDKNGDMWLATQRGYLVKWNGENNSFTLQHKLKTVISRIYIDTENYVWVCTDLNGVFRINCSSGNITETYTSIGPKGTTILINGASDMIQYNDSIFVIASEGLNVLNIRRGSFKYFTTENGLPSVNITNLAKDKDGYIWMSSAVGILSYHPFKKKLSLYNATDGVHTNSFNVASGAVLNDGRIAFGTYHDFIVFEPSSVTVDDYVPPKVAITGFALMNKNLLVDSLHKLPRIKLHHFEHSLTIELSTLTYQNHYDIYYRVEGLDDDWVKAGKLNQVNLNYIPPGKYTFKAGCKDAKGNIGRITTMEIYITPPFYKTWWFAGLLAFAAIGILYWIDKFRVAQIRDTERMRTRIATSLTKDMSNTLSNINVLSELAKVKLDKDTERTREYIGQISDKSSRMMEVMDDMIWSINPENDEMQFTILRMKKYATTVQARYNVEISFTIHEKVKEIKLQMDRRHELFLIYKEALLNTGMHAGSKFADVDIRYENGKIKLSIVDNGKGFDTNEACFGRGLNEMRKKATALNASLRINAEINTGTTVILIMAV
ncbi:MAG: hypothetical protein H7Z13_04445 [Ferruginibacter sp.]|nr:hypothetical protein [Ferruginibacter sp.]